jgi:hypothetical protein
VQCITALLESRTVFRALPHFSPSIISPIFMVAASSNFCPVIRGFFFFFAI